LYADMGHFGRKPIRAAWFGIAFPALLVNYFGQGALLVAEGENAVENPFYQLAPDWALYPMVIITTAATVIASQALISGAYSVAQQAIQLGFWPRMTIIHTSREASGQIYIPEVNWALMVACVALTVGFRASTNLAAAYGIAVVATMTITTLLLYAVARGMWGWKVWQAMALCGLFLAVDLPLLGANLIKIAHGGWVPVVVGLVLFGLMTTWKRGRRALHDLMTATQYPIEKFLGEMPRRQPLRVQGTAVFMTSTTGGTPPVLMHHFKHNKVLHEKVILLTIETEGMPEVPKSRRVQVRELGHGFWEVVAHYGFMETPNVPSILRRCEEKGLRVAPEQASYFLGRETILATGRSKLPYWRKLLFIYMSRNARPANAFFRIPSNRVVELGAQVEL
jgi:KUP system potassium uptake protein